MPGRRKSEWILLVHGCAMLAAAVVASAGSEPSWLSDQGIYRIRYDSLAEPVVINRMHAWILSVETADGKPVESATLTVSGGMPAHRHGLPTRPRIVEDLGNGQYRLEGLRFHMPGAWEIVVTIEAGATVDRVVIPLAL